MSPPAASDRALSVGPSLRRLLADGRVNPSLGFPETAVNFYRWYEANATGSSGNLRFP